MACGPCCWVVFLCTWAYAVGFKSKTTQQSVEVTKSWYRRLAQNFSEDSYEQLQSEGVVGSHWKRFETSSDAVVSSFTNATLEKNKQPVHANKQLALEKKKPTYQSLEALVEGGLLTWPTPGDTNVSLAEMSVAAFLGQRLELVQDTRDLLASAISSSRAMKMFKVWSRIRDDEGARLLFLGGDPAKVGLCEAEAAKVVLCFNTVLRVHDGKARIDSKAVPSAGEKRTLQYKNDTFEGEWKDLKSEERDALLEVFGGKEAAAQWAIAERGFDFDKAESASILQFLEENHILAIRERTRAVNTAALARENDREQQRLKEALVQEAKKRVDMVTKAEDAKNHVLSKECKWHVLHKSKEWTSDFNTQLSDLVYQGFQETEKDRALISDLIWRSNNAKAYFDLRSRLTLTNAVEMLKLLIGVVAPRPIKATIFLVSNSFHLPRAMYIFQAVLETAKAVWVYRADKGGWIFYGRDYKDYIDMYKFVVQDAIPKRVETQGHDMAQFDSQKQLEAFFWALRMSEITFTPADCGFKRVDSQIESLVGKQLIQGKGKVRQAEDQDAPGADHEVLVGETPYPLAKFLDGLVPDSYLFDGDFCKLNPDIFKASGSFNRIETINWNLAMLIPRVAAYGWCMSEEFLRLPNWGDDARVTSWADAENKEKGGIPVPEGSLAFVARAATDYITLAGQYFWEEERLSLEAMHPDDILCPHLLQWILQHLCTADVLADGSGAALAAHYWKTMREAFKMDSSLRTGEFEIWLRDTYPSGSMMPYLEQLQAQDAARAR